MSTPSNTPQTLAFIGGGNMASAIIGGLIKQGTPASRILVVEPFEEARQRLQAQFGVRVLAAADAALTEAGLVIWAVKPQTFKEAAQQTRDFCNNALHLSVAAGIRSDSIAEWLDTERVVRAMPNTPALVGLGQTGLFARPSVTLKDKQWIEQVVATTGQHLWVDDETLLDAVTAISGSGPAYVFFFIEAMVDAGVKMGLTEAQAHHAGDRRVDEGRPRVRQDHPPLAGPPRGARRHVRPGLGALGAVRQPGWCRHPAEEWRRCGCGAHPRHQEGAGDEHGLHSALLLCRSL